MDVGTGVELECSYGAGDGQTRSEVASMPKERSGGPRLDKVLTGKTMDMDMSDFIPIPILTTLWVIRVLDNTEDHYHCHGFP